MAQTQQAIFSHGLQQRIDYTPGSAVDSGDFVFFGSGLERLVAVATEALEADKVGAVEIIGIYKVKKKDGVAFSTGDLVSWDTGNEEAVAAGDAAEDVQLGVCVGDAASGDDYVLTRINMARGFEASGANGGL